MRIKLLFKVALAGLVAASAQANTITPELLSFTPGVSIAYQAKLTSGEVHAGDGFTIFDIGGFLGFGAIAPGWIASASPFGSPWGISPLGVDTGDLNVTFTYTGAPYEQVFGAFPFTPFTVLTKSTLLVTEDWTSRDHLIATPFVIDGGVGTPHRDQILVPAHVPEGGLTLILLGGALTSLAFVQRKVFSRR